MVIVTVIITFVHQSECEEAEGRGESKLSPVLLVPHWGMGAHVTHKRIQVPGRSHDTQTDPVPECSRDIQKNPVSECSRDTQKDPVPGRSRDTRKDPVPESSSHLRH